VNLSSSLLGSHWLPRLGSEKRNLTSRTSTVTLRADCQRHIAALYLPVHYQKRNSQQRSRAVPVQHIVDPSDRGMILDGSMPALSYGRVSIQKCTDTGSSIPYNVGTSLSSTSAVCSALRSQRAGLQSIAVCIKGPSQASAMGLRFF
jgi:hypothetical protein